MRSNSSITMVFGLRRKFLFLFLLLLPCTMALTTDVEEEPEDYLSEKSVIVITGAAGFLGSELALALHRTHSPRKIICIDQMGDHPQSKEELALFEFQRQRAFHVMQTLGPKGSFYRVDFRPMIPEYFDLGEVPVLDHIFRENPDITHVVHLADAYPHLAPQVIPRDAEVPRAGMMEALLEQIYKVKRASGRRMPHFTYASSSEVYPSNSSSHQPPFSESLPLSTPSSLRGASKLIDEVLAKVYHDMHGIFSVGLRFFAIYGPWSVPGSPLFEMAERAVTGDAPLSEYDGNVRDYVYIEDAIDALLAAMQFRPQIENPPPVVINVASGEGTTLQQIAEIMESYFPPGNEQKDDNTSKERTHEFESVTVSYGSTSRAENLLGFKPIVPLEDGITKLLAWHYDRAFPYGGSRDATAASSQRISMEGIASCLPYDKECLKAAPVFPCSSECSHEAQCTDSFYDDVVGWTQALTANCETVLYTVALEESLDTLPSVHMKFKPSSQSFVNGPCNLAFVSETSVLVQSARRANRLSSFVSFGDKTLKFGRWILVPLTVPSFPTDDENVLKLLPKLSPSLFFGAATKHAIYCDPNILLDNVPKLLQEAKMQPYSNEVDGATAMLIGKDQPQTTLAYNEFTPRKQVFQNPRTTVQNAAYRMVRIAVLDELFGDGFMDLLDSRWLVHTLQSDDSRLFRCDVYGEVVQWEVDTDRSAWEFIIGLHDMWSRVITKQSGLDPWWIGDGVITVPEGQAPIRRRLQENSNDVEEEQDEDDHDTSKFTKADSTNTNNRADEEHSNELDGVAAVLAANQQLGSDDEGLEDGGEVGMRADVAQQEVVNAGDKKRGESSEQDDDQIDDDNEADIAAPVIERDLSSYDTWMGVLSATSVQYFVRIVPSSEVGILSMDQFKTESSES